MTPKFKRISTWVVGVIFLAFLGYLFYRFHIGLTEKTWNLIRKQWLAIIVFPSACFACLVVVMILDRASGDMEFKAMGFEFKGAAAPVVIWGFLVLIMAASLSLLWQQ